MLAGRGCMGAMNRGWLVGPSSCAGRHCTALCLLAPCPMPSPARACRPEPPQGDFLEKLAELIVKNYGASNGITKSDIYWIGGGGWVRVAPHCCLPEGRGLPVCCPYQIRVTVGMYFEVVARPASVCSSPSFECFGFAPTPLPNPCP